MSHIEKKFLLHDYLLHCISTNCQLNSLPINHHFLIASVKEVTCRQLHYWSKLKYREWVRACCWSQVKITSLLLVWKVIGYKNEDETRKISTSTCDYQFNPEIVVTVFWWLTSLMLTPPSFYSIHLPCWMRINEVFQCMTHLRYDSEKFGLKPNKKKHEKKLIAEEKLRIWLQPFQWEVFIEDIFGN